MANVRMKAPEGETSLCHQQQQFTVRADGTVTVPDAFVPALEGLGYRLVAVNVGGRPPRATAAAHAPEGDDGGSA